MNTGDRRSFWTACSTSNAVCMPEFTFDLYLLQCSPVDGCVYWDELVVLVHTNFLAPPSQRVCPTEPQVDGGAIAAEYSVVQWTGVYIGMN